MKKENPFKNAALAMSHAVADDAIVGSVHSKRSKSGKGHGSAPMTTSARDESPAEEKGESAAKESAETPDEISNEKSQPSRGVPAGAGPGETSERSFPPPGSDGGQLDNQHSISPHVARVERSFSGKNKRSVTVTGPKHGRGFQGK